jgi:hypothetical protein
MSDSVLLLQGSSLSLVIQGASIAFVVSIVLLRLSLVCNQQAVEPVPLALLWTVQTRVVSLSLEKES